MNLKRLLTGIIGFPIVLAFLVLANKYVVDIAMTIVSIISIYEYSKCAKNKGINVVSWVGYVSCLLIAILHILPTNLIVLIIAINFIMSLDIVFCSFVHTLLSI